MELLRGKQPGAIKCLLYGVEGIGKSTFASYFPSPVFIDIEGSTTHMDVVRTPKPTSWAMLLEQVKHFIQNPDQLSTLVVDTVDWAEKLCMEQICASKQMESIESAGYGRGYVYLAEEFGKFLNLLEELRCKGVHIALTAHAAMRKFEQPDEMGAYDRLELKLQKKTAPLCKEWVDAIFLANYKTFVLNVDGQGAAKGKNKAQGGKRVMYTTHHPCWDAKNRFGLPDELPFDYTAIAHLFATDHRSHTSPQPAPRQEPAPEETPPSIPESPAMPSPFVRDPGDGNPTDSPIQPPPAPSDTIPQALRDLMEKDNVTEQEIMFAVSAKGYYPSGTPIARYDPAYINGVLIAAWPQVRSMVETNRLTTPF